MATDHRGKDVHAGKRTDDELGRQVSRLAHLMTTQANRNAFSNYVEKPENTQKLLNDYRQNRDNPSSLPENVEHDANFISKSFKGRHHDWMGESGSVDLNKFSSRQEIPYDEPRDGRYPAD